MVAAAVLLAAAALLAVLAPGRDDTGRDDTGRDDESTGVGDNLSDDAYRDVRVEL